MYRKMVQQSARPNGPCMFVCAMEGHVALKSLVQCIDKNYPKYFFAVLYSLLKIPT